MVIPKITGFPHCGPKGVIPAFFGLSHHMGLAVVPKMLHSKLDHTGKSRRFQGLVFDCHSSQFGVGIWRTPSSENQPKLFARVEKAQNICLRSPIVLLEFWLNEYLKNQRMQWFFHFNENDSLPVIQTRVFDSSLTK